MLEADIKDITVSKNDSDITHYTVSQKNDSDVAHYNFNAH